MNPDEVYRLALKLYGDPVEAKIAAAQMQLETGGGRAMPGNNLFGIKGPGQSLRTMESVDGKMTPTTASFRTYSDPRASIIDRLRFLEDNPRYAEAGYFQAVTPEQKADALQRAGYATDPNYATKLKSILSGGGPMIYDASDFPQFAPGGMGLVPVSAQPPGPAGVLGVTPVQPLLGPAQPQGLLDRFAPGSGYGYDVALGIAQTQGGPMTALAGGFAHAKDRAFERQMGEANLQLAQARMTGAGGRLPPNVEEMMWIKQINPNLSDQEAMSLAFTGRMPKGGRKFEMVGDQMLWVEYDEWGRPSYTPLTAEEQARYQGVIEAQAGARAKGTQEAQQRVKNREAFRSAYTAGVNTIPGEVAGLRRLLGELESGVYGTGPIRGPLQQRFNTALQVLNFEALRYVLNNLEEVSTGGMTDQEWKILFQGGPSADKTVAANTKIVRDLLRRAESEYDRLVRQRDLMRMPEFDPLTWAPELPEIEILPTRFPGEDRNPPPPGAVER